MPFGRRVKAAFKRRLLASKQPPKRNRPRVSGNWHPVSEETMALLNGINRPAHMIEKDMLVTGVEIAELRSLKTALERRMNELRIEEMRLREVMMDNDNGQQSGDEDNECRMSGSSGYESEHPGDSPNDSPK